MLLLTRDRDHDVEETLDEPEKPTKVIRWTPDVREIHGHILVTRSELTAWYRLGPVRWAWSNDTVREATINQLTTALADLTDFEGVTVRVSNRPYPVQAWAETLDRITPDPLPGGPGHDWASYLRGAQRTILHRATDKAVFLIEEDGVVVRETFGIDFDELQEIVGVPLRPAAR